MSFNLKSHRCEKCGEVTSGEGTILHFCPKLDDNKLFTVHQIRTAAFYSKLEMEQINKIIRSLSELFLRGDYRPNAESSENLKVDRRSDGFGC